MFQTLQYVNAAVRAGADRNCPRPSSQYQSADFRRFSDHGLQHDLGHVPQTRLWELATYELKPQLNRMTGVSTVVVQGGQVPEFEIRPDPGKLLQSQITVPNLLDAIGEQSDRFAGSVRETTNWFWAW